MDDNKTLWRVAELIRVLTNAPAGQILIGRENIIEKDYTARIYLVDALPSSMIVSNMEKFDGVAEVMKYSTLSRHDVTIDIYGKTAYTDATQLIGLLKSQLASDTKRSLGLSGFAISSKTDLKELTGTQYINRIQLTCVVMDCETVEVETLRIDTAQLEIITEEGRIL